MAAAQQFMCSTCGAVVYKGTELQKHAKKRHGIRLSKTDVENSKRKQ